MKGFRKGDLVYDTWWPYVFGRVIKTLKTRVRVKWLYSREEVSYDTAHAKFLKKASL